MEKIFCQITSGRGPVEVTRAVVLMLNNLIDDAKKQGLDTEIVEYEEGTKDGTMFSCVISVAGTTELVNAFKQSWNGTVQWISTKNPYRPEHKRKNWFVGVSFFCPVESSSIKETDIIYETLRRSGPGGQNVNKVETAVRALHKLSGLTVVASDERNQAQNKRLARERIIAKLSAMEEARKQQQSFDVWMKHNLLQRGNPVKTFKGEL